MTPSYSYYILYALSEACSGKLCFMKPHVVNEPHAVMCMQALLLIANICCFASSEHLS